MNSTLDGASGWLVVVDWWIGYMAPNKSEYFGDKIKFNSALQLPTVKRLSGMSATSVIPLYIFIGNGNSGVRKINTHIVRVEHLTRTFDRLFFSVWSCFYTNIIPISSEYDTSEHKMPSRLVENSSRPEIGEPCIMQSLYIGIYYTQFNLFM